MFYYISGTLVHKTDSFAVIDAGGIGYKIYSTLPSLKAIGEPGSDAKLYTYMNIKNASDVLALYGFATTEELNVFEMILGVSGIGAKTAANLLSNVSPSKFALCVITDDSKYLSANTPGLGPKGAKRLVLELKDKFKGLDIDSMSKDEILNGNDSADDNSEALAALIALGYSLREAESALRKTSGTTEEKIKAGLKNLMKG